MKNYDRSRILNWGISAGIALGVMVSVGLLLHSATSEKNWRRRHKEFLGLVTEQLGRKEKEVLVSMGQPVETVTRDEAGRRGGKYAWEGYASPNRPISAKVLIYVRGDAIAYIYLNDKGIVEDVFYGPS